MRGVAACVSILGMAGNYFVGLFGSDTRTTDQAADALVNGGHRGFHVVNVGGANVTYSVLPCSKADQSDG